MGRREEIKIKINTIKCCQIVTIDTGEEGGRDDYGVSTCDRLGYLP